MRTAHTHGYGDSVFPGLVRVWTEEPRGVDQARSGSRSSESETCLSQLLTAELAADEGLKQVCKCQSSQSILASYINGLRCPNAMA